MEVVEALPKIVNVSPDLIVVAGDLGKPSHLSAISEWLDDLCPVAIVLGNHDFWDMECSMDDCIEKWRSTVLHVNQTRSYPIHLIQDDTVYLSTKSGTVRVFGGTLWTDFEFYASDPTVMTWSNDVLLNKIKATMPDEYRRINHGYIEPQEIQERHFITRSHIESELSVPFEGPSIIVTHHLPSAKSISARYRGQLLNAGFASHLDYMLDKTNALWLHGHIHHSVAYPTRGGGIVATNPVGCMMKDNLPINDFFKKSMFAEYLGSDTTLSWALRQPESFESR
jgi:Icc-related predicted phosphoesterase